MSSEQAETAPPKPDRGESVELFDYGQLRDYAGFMLRSPGRHGFLAVASFLVVVGLAGAQSMLLPDAYQSEATILARAPAARSRRPPRRDRIPAARPPAPGERERPRRSHWLASTVAARAPHWPAASTSLGERHGRQAARWDDGERGPLATGQRHPQLPQREAASARTVGFGPAVRGVPIPRPASLRCGRSAPCRPYGDAPPLSTLRVRNLGAATARHGGVLASRDGSAAERGLT